MFGDELRLAKFVVPMAQVDFSQERIERLLLRPKLFRSRAVLLFESVEEPFENKESPFGRVRLLRRRNKERCVLCPVC